MASKYTHEFKKPWEYEGKTYEKIEFDFGKLTGEDLISAESELNNEGVNLFLPEYNYLCKAKLASRASGIGDDILRAMPIRDFKAIAGKVTAFLNFGDLEEE